MKKMGIKLIVSLVMIGILILPNYAYAEINPDEYKPSDLGGNTKLQQKGNLVVGVIQAVGTVVSVAALIGIAIKYMMGSVEEKAEYKETMGPYLIGAALLFGTTNILGIIYGVANRLNN